MIDRALHIDLNADLGEGFDTDATLLTMVSSANISCGAHAGDLDSISGAIRGAAEAGVTIGAHPSFPDRRNFGRLPLALSSRELRETITSQLLFLQQLVQAEGLALAHVKPHGALYNQAARDSELAQSLVRIIADFNPTLVICGLAGSQLIQAASQEGLKTLQEGFIDRHYHPDGSLLARSHPEAVIREPERALEQALGFIEKELILSHCGRSIAIQANTLCIHGDNPDAIGIASAVRQGLLARGIRICAPGVEAPDSPGV